MSEPLRPLNIAIAGAELGIAWNDGTEAFFPLEFLRRSCPCASCGGEPDVLGRGSRPEVSYTENSFQLKGYERIGGYAIQPTWGDGHSTGIYSWNYLHQLSGNLPRS